MLTASFPQSPHHLDPSGLVPSCLRADVSRQGLGGKVLGTGQALRLSILLDTQLGGKPQLCQWWAITLCESMPEIPSLWPRREA